MLNDDFVNRMKLMLKDDFNAFIKSYEDSPSRAIRVNKEKITVDDFLRIFPYETIKSELSEDCLYLKTDEKLGRSVFHHAGMIYLQEPSAMLPAYSYDFLDGIKILDLCASPGGKTSQLAVRNPHGLVVSNEINYKRAQVLASNIERQGYKNVIITNASPNELSSSIKGFFDLILVDAPCSGEGMFRKDEEAVKDWSLDLVSLNSKRQKEILDNAMIMLKENGILIYSTCTFSYQENEDNVSYLLENGFELIKPNDKTLRLTTFFDNEYCRRFYPHIGLGEGQFFAVLRKKHEATQDYSLLKQKNKLEKEVNDFLDDNIEGIELNIIKVKDMYYHVPYSLALPNVISYGVALGNVVKGRFVPHHNFFTAFGNYFKNKLIVDYTDHRVNKYLRGEEIDGDVSNGFGAIIVNGVSLGGFKSSNGRLKNYYPKGLRNF